MLTALLDSDPCFMAEELPLRPEMADVIVELLPEGDPEDPVLVVLLALCSPE